MNDNLISREELLFEIRQQVAFQKEKAKLTTIDADKMSHSLFATGIQLAIDIIDNAPTVTPPYTFSREELKAWLYAIAINNLDGLERDKIFADDCKEIIDRLDGFERFVKDRREGKI
jgi:hypothetical protein